MVTMFLFICFRRHVAMLRDVNMKQSPELHCVTRKAFKYDYFIIFSDQLRDVNNAYIFSNDTD